MLLFLRKDRSPDESEEVVTAIREAGFILQPVGRDILAIFGGGDVGPLEGLPGVERMDMDTLAPQLARRGDRTGTTPVEVGPATFGTGFVVIAGPCSVEDRGRLFDLAMMVKEAGGDMLRGGAFKPRTSPYSFRGLGPKGLELLREVGDASGLPVVTEVLDTRDVQRVAEAADMLQIGARSMTNHALLIEAGKAGKPILLKRGMAATIEELVCSAEYLLLEGAPGVVLCERGIRTFSESVRNTLDISAVPVLTEETHLPVIVDPSHATGRRELVPPMARAAAAAGSAGVIIEIHDDPKAALSDGRQALDPRLLPGLVRQMREIARICSESTKEDP